MTSDERREKRYIRRKQERENKKSAFLKKYNDFSLVTDPNNLYKAFMKSKKGVNWKTSVQRYEINILRNIYETINKLENDKNITMGFKEFYLKERGKIRKIKNVHIMERVVKKCFCDEILVPLLSRFLIYDNGASIKNKGVSFSVKRLKVHLMKYYKKYETNKGYCLQIDFTKYFDSIVHKHLMRMIKKYITNKQILKLMNDFINSFGNGVSLGLGSQVSQIAAVFYLNEIDHIIKEEYGIEFFSRYMDDLILLFRSKKKAINILENITKECSQIGIEINNRKTKINKIKDRISYLKGNYKLTESRKVVITANNESKKRMRKKLLKFNKLYKNGRISIKDIYTSYQSWRGTYRKRFSAFYTIKRMDSLYNKLFIYNHLEENHGKRVFVESR
jgi:hypothetical protein